MGNTTSLLNKETCQGIINPRNQLLPQIKLLCKTNNDYFGAIQVWRPKTTNNQNGKIFSKIKYGADQMEKDQMVAVHNKQCELNHVNLIKYYGCTFFDKYELTTNTIECHSYYEFPDCNLIHVIDHHKKHLDLVREPKVLQIIYDISSALQYLQEMGLFHGDLNSESIFLDDKTNRAKILEHGAVFGMQTGYAKVLVYNKQALLSPQFLKSAEVQTVNPSDSWIKNDIFALGMTILEVISQKSSYECYNFSDYTIDQDLIEQRLNGAYIDGYSQDFINILKEMVKQEEDQRIDPLTLQNKVSTKMQVNLSASSNLVKIQNLQSRHMSNQSVSPNRLQSVQQIQKESIQQIVQFNGQFNGQINNQQSQIQNNSSYYQSLSPHQQNMQTQNTLSQQTHTYKFLDASHPAVSSSQQLENSQKQNSVNQKIYPQQTLEERNLQQISPNRLSKNYQQQSSPGPQSQTHTYKFLDKQNVTSTSPSRIHSSSQHQNGLNQYSQLNQSLDFSNLQNQSSPQFSKNYQQQSSPISQPLTQQFLDQQNSNSTNLNKINSNIQQQNSQNSQTHTYKFQAEQNIQSVSPTRIPSQQSNAVNQQVQLSQHTQSQQINNYYRTSQQTQAIQQVPHQIPVQQINQQTFYQNTQPQQQTYSFEQQQNPIQQQQQADLIRQSYLFQPQEVQTQIRADQTLQRQTFGAPLQQDQLFQQNQHQYSSPRESQQVFIKPTLGNQFQAQGIDYGQIQSVESQNYLPSQIQMYSTPQSIRPQIYYTPSTQFSSGGNLQNDDSLSLLSKSDNKQYQIQMSMDDSTTIRERRIRKLEKLSQKADNALLHSREAIRKYQINEY